MARDEDERSEASGDGFTDTDDGSGSEGTLDDARPAFGWFDPSVQCGAVFKRSTTGERQYVCFHDLTKGRCRRKHNGLWKHKPEVPGHYQLVKTRSTPLRYDGEVDKWMSEQDYTKMREEASEENQRMMEEVAQGWGPRNASKIHPDSTPLKNQMAKAKDFFSKASAAAGERMSRSVGWADRSDEEDPRKPSPRSQGATSTSPSSTGLSINAEGEGQQALFELVGQPQTEVRRLQGEGTQPPKDTRTKAKVVVEDASEEESDPEGKSRSTKKDDRRSSKKESRSRESKSSSRKDFDRSSRDKSNKETKKETRKDSKKESKETEPSKDSTTDGEKSTSENKKGGKGKHRRKHSRRRESSSESESDEESSSTRSSRSRSRSRRSRRSRRRARDRSSSSESYSSSEGDDSSRSRRRSGRRPSRRRKKKCCAACRGQGRVTYGAFKTKREQRDVYRSCSDAKRKNFSSKKKAWRWIDKHHRDFSSDSESGHSTSSYDSSSSDDSQIKRRLKERSKSSTTKGEPTRTPVELSGKDPSTKKSDELFGISLKKNTAKELLEKMCPPGVSSKHHEDLSEAMIDGPSLPVKTQSYDQSHTEQQLGEVFGELAHQMSRSRRGVGETRKDLKWKHENKTSLKQVKDLEELNASYEEVISSSEESLEQVFAIHKSILSRQPWEETTVDAWSETGYLPRICIDTVN